MLLPISIHKSALTSLRLHPLTRPTPIMTTFTRTVKSKASRSETLPNTPIRVLRSLPALRQWRKPHVLNQRLVGLVPTMGALHSGHLSLIRSAARHNHEVVVSIYVNPTQFGASEDLDSYPATWDADAEILARLDRELADEGANMGRISAVFAPSAADMYPTGVPGQDPDSKGSFVTVTPVGELLEGSSRPTFFRGVATVCMKLFNAVQPDRVYFGQKDVQQTVVIRKMIRDFLLPIEVEVCPTEREPDGLAMSSRNVYLGARRRRTAIVLHGTLSTAQAVYGAGLTDRASILGSAQEMANAVLSVQEGMAPEERTLFEVDYLSLADPDTMEEVDAVDPERGAVLSGAIRMLPVEKPQEGEDLGHSHGPPVRLIDNIILKPREAKQE